LKTSFLWVFIGFQNSDLTTVTNVTEFLRETGVKNGEILSICRTFREAYRNINYDHIIVKRDGKNYFKSNLKELDALLFDTEEQVNLFVAIHLLNPKKDDEKKRNLFQMIIKLMDVESEWSF
jgi:hypothetical protein